MRDLGKLIREAEGISSRFDRIDSAMSDNFRRFGHINPAVDWDSLTTPKVNKFTAGLVIIDQASLENYSSILDIRVALQIAKLDTKYYGQPGTYYRVAVPGGAIQSDEERAFIDSGIVPANDVHRAFYYVVEDQLHKGEELRMTYQNAESKAEEYLRSEVIRKVTLEMGEAATASLEFLALIPQTKVSYLPNMTLVNPVKTAEIAERLAPSGITHKPGTTTLTGVYTRVSEQAIVAKADVSKLLDDVEETDYQRGVRLFTIAEVLRIGESCANEDDYINYRRRYPNDRHDGLRNPSAAFLVGEFVRELRRECERAAPNKEDANPRRHFRETVLGSE